MTKYNQSFKQRVIEYFQLERTTLRHWIKGIREKSQTSQAVFANYLNISKNLVSEWERGVKKPSGTALKLLTLVQKKGLDAIA